MRIKIYHNSRCSKSNAALNAIKSQETEVQVINYLENPPSVNELKDLLKLLGIGPLALMRTTETVFKEKVKGRQLSAAQLIQIMHENPILIQRPIVIKGDKALIARTQEAISHILQIT